MSRQSYGLAHLKDQFDVADVKFIQLRDFVVGKLGVPDTEGSLMRLFKIFSQNSSDSKVNVSEFSAVLEEYLPKKDKVDEFFSGGESPKKNGVSLSRIESLIEQIRKKVRETPGYSVYMLAERIDVDKKGGVDLMELYSFLKSFVPELQKAEVKALFDRADRDKNGTLSIDEVAEFFGLAHFRNDPTLMKELDKKTNSQFDNILADIIQEIVKKRTMTLDSVFDLSTLAKMSRTEFLARLKIFGIVPDKYLNFEDFFRQIQVKQTDSKQPLAIDLSKLRVLLDQHYKSQLGENVSEDVIQRTEMFLFDLLYVFNNDLTQIMLLYDQNNMGLITLPEFCIASKRALKSQAPPSTYEPIYKGCKEPQEATLRSSMFKLKLMEVLAKYNAVNTKPLNPQVAAGFPDLKLDYSPVRGNHFVFEGPTTGTNSSPMSLPGDYSPMTQMQLKKLDLISPEEKKRKDQESLYAKVREQIGYMDEDLIKRFKHADTNKTNRLHPHYIFSTLKEMNCDLSDREKELILEPVSKDNNLVLYLDFVSRLFPMKQMMEIKNSADLTVELVKQQHMARKTFTDLWNDAKDPEKDEMSLSHFKKFLVARGFLIADKVMNHIYEEFDTSRKFSVDAVEFKAQFNASGGTQTGAKLAIYVRDFLKALNKTSEDAFKPFVNPKSNTFDFIEFSNALEELKMNLKYFDYEVLFLFLDTDKSGTLSFEELKKKLEVSVPIKDTFDTKSLRMAMYKLIKTKYTGIQDFLEVLDSGKKRYLNFDEFKSLVKAVDLKGLNTDADIKPMYEALDVDRDYFLSYKEIITFYDEPTILVLFPFVVQFRDALLGYLKNTGHPIFYLVRKYSSGHEEMKINDFSKLCEEINFNPGSDENMKLLFQEVDSSNNGSVSSAELRRNLAGDIVDIIALVERVQNALRGSPVTIEKAFFDANSGSNEGISFKEFCTMLYNRLGIFMGQIEAEELFMFVQCNGQNKIFINEFTSVFGFGHRINPFQYNKAYMEQLPEESRKYYLSKYGVLLRSNNAMNSQGGVNKQPAYNRERDQALVAGKSGAVNFTQEGVVGNQAAPYGFSGPVIPVMGQSPSQLIRLQNAGGPLDHKQGIPIQLSEIDKAFAKKIDARTQGGSQLPTFFQSHDHDTSNSLTIEELTSMMKDVKLNFTEDQKNQIFLKMNPVDGRISYNNFKAYYDRVKVNIEETTFDPTRAYQTVENKAVEMMEATGQNFERIFAGFQRKSRLGMLTDEWEALLKTLRLDEVFNQEEVEAIFKSLNKKGDGQLSFIEFTSVFRTLTYEQWKDRIIASSQSKLIDDLRVKCQEVEKRVNPNGRRDIGFIESDFMARDFKRSGEIEYADFRSFFIQHDLIRNGDEKLTKICEMFAFEGMPNKIDYMRFLVEMNLISKEKVELSNRLRQNAQTQSDVLEFSSALEQHCQTKKIPLLNIFDQYDRRQKGYLDRGDFKELVADVDRNIGQYGDLEKDKLFSLIDTNGSDKILKEEFVKSLLPNHYRTHLLQRYNQFVPEYATINNELRTQNRADLKSFFMTKEGLVSNVDFRKSASLLGLNPSSSRYYDLLSAFTDPEKQNFIDIDKLQRMLDESKGVNTGVPQSPNRQLNNAAANIAGNQQGGLIGAKTVRFAEEIVEGTNAAPPNMMPVAVQDPPLPNGMRKNLFDDSHYQIGQNQGNSMLPANPANYNQSTVYDPLSSLQGSQVAYAPGSGLPYMQWPAQAQNYGFSSMGSSTYPQPPAAAFYSPRKFTPEERTQVKKVVANIVNYLEEDLKQPRDVFSLYDPRNSNSISIKDMQRALTEDLYIILDENCDLFVEYYRDGPDKINLTQLYSDLDRFKKAKVDKRKFDLTLIQESLAGNRLALKSKDELVGYSHPVKDDILSKRCMARIEQLKDFYYVKHNLSNYRLFEYLDANKDHVIVKKEFFSKSIDDGFDSCSRDELDEVFKFIDINKNGVITLTEFKYFFYDRSFLENEAEKATTELDDDLRQLFRRIDAGNSGFVNSDEVVRCLNILGYPATPEMIEVEFKEFDFDKDNRFDYKEFRRYMHSKMRGTVFRMDHMTDDIRKKFQKIHPTNGQVFNLVQFAAGIVAAAPDITVEEIQAAFFEVDQDQTGEVHIDDILAFVKRPPDDRESPLVANAILKMKKSHVLPLKDLTAIYREVPQSFCTAFTRLNFLELKNLPSDSLYPKLMPNTLAYSDLFGEYTDQKKGLSYPVKPVDSKILRTITVSLATGVPIPDEAKVQRKEMIIARELRAVLFDRNTHKFVGGTLIHTCNMETRIRGQVVLRE